MQQMIKPKLICELSFQAAFVMYIILRFQNKQSVSVWREYLRDNWSQSVMIICLSALIQKPDGISCWLLEEKIVIIGSVIIQDRYLGMTDRQICPNISWNLCNLPNKQTNKQTKQTKQTNKGKCNKKSWKQIYKIITMLKVFR